MDASGKLRKLLGNNRGVAFVYIALTLFVLIAFLGLSLDIGYMYVVKGQLQNAADASALAGAARLHGANNVAEFSNHSGARREAWRFACRNRAAGSNVFVVDSGATDCGSPPADLNNSNDATGDIVLGYWDGATFLEVASGTILTPPAMVNAVKVVARRTSGSPLGPVDVFVGQIFRIINSDWSQMSARSESIASIEGAPALPIAVNEYWMSDPTLPLGQKPYGTRHDYPNSFVRSNNPPLPGAPPVSDPIFGLTFAILGSNADDNIPNAGVPGSKNMNGFVDLDARTFNHDGSGISWFDVLTSIASPINCSSCSSGFTGPVSKNTGSISSQKFDISITYLHKGYDPTYILPTAIREQYLVPPLLYPNNSNTIYPLNPTSNCPYATLAYFPSSGNQPLNKKFEGMTFNERFPTGKKVVALVYDGTFVPDTDPNMPNAVTVVGYSLLQIDGYASGNPKTLGLNGTGPTTNIGTSGNTVYAHALENIVEPQPGETCDEFSQRIKALQFRGGTPKLVK